MHVSIRAGSFFHLGEAADMVRVSMGQQNMTDIAGLFAQFAYGLNYFISTAGKTCVNQRITIRRGEEKCIYMADRNGIQSTHNLLRQH